MDGQLRLADALGTFRVEHPAPGPHVARPAIAAARSAGMGPAAIARHLNATGVPTPSGRGRWRPETVARVEHPERWAAYMRRWRAANPGSRLASSRR